MITFEEAAMVKLNPSYTHPCPLLCYCHMPNMIVMGVTLTVGFNHESPPLKTIKLLAS